MCDEAGKDYEKDKRPACKYGSDCYQKNPQHLEKYKHPSKKRKFQTDKPPPAKKFKISDYFKANTKQKQEGESASTKKEKRDVGDKATKLEDNSSTSSEKEKRDVGDKATKLEDNSGTSSNKGNQDETEISSTSKEVNSCNKCTKESNKEPQPGKYQALLDKEKSPQEVPIKSPANEEKPTSSNAFNRRNFIKEKFLFSMPSDFYDFWEFCKSHSQQNPCDALKSVGLKLVGVYDVLAGKFDEKQSISGDEYLLHWRYYHDIPEVQTVLKGDDSQGYHIGYFRDSPSDLPGILVSNCAKTNGIFQCVGDNIFAAVNTYLEELKQSGDPFKKMHVNKFQSSLKSKAEQLGLNLSKKSDKIVNREKKIVARTFNRVGLVVPYNKKTQLGYRPLTIGNKELRILLDKLEKSTEADRDKYLSQLQPVLTYASIATDECDFGTGIELGWNIISHGVSCLNKTAATFLTTSYKLLNRNAFGKIAEAHMSNRRKGCKLSIV